MAAALRLWDIKRNRIFHNLPGSSYDRFHNSHERFLLYHPVLDRVGNQLCQGFHKGFLKDKHCLRLDHLYYPADHYICHVRLMEGENTWEKDW
jgi:hypothetical protein